MLKKILNALNGKKGEILINIVLLFTLKTGIKVNNFDFKMDYRQIERVEYREFDPDLQQAPAWKRLEYGVHTEEDKIWLMHEYAEHRHEKTHNSGYSEAHDQAQKRFDGAPWENNY